jgi:hypothetical protein
VLVDGVARSRFDLTDRGQLQIELAEGDKLIELKGVDEDGELLLGTQLISYTDGTFEFSKVIQSFSNGKLGLTVSPVPVPAMRPVLF